MKFTSEIIKKAWSIRKAAAGKYGCKVMEISWAVCLKLAKGDEKMNGSEKQVKWAKGIQSKMIEEIESAMQAIAPKAEKRGGAYKAKYELFAKTKGFVADITEAAILINNRQVKGTDFIHYAAKAKNVVEFMISINN